MIILGSAKPLNRTGSGMPQIQSAFTGWTSKISVTTIKQSLINGFVKDVATTRTFQGVIQPFGPKQLMLKPEGERDWGWWMIHCFSGNLNIDSNDRIDFDGKRYKVMEVNDYSRDNYIEYHVIKDYNNVAAPYVPPVNTPVLLTAFSSAFSSAFR